MNTRKQGDIGVAAAILYFTRQGWAVSKPLADSQRYDLVIDDGAKLLRVECKTSRYIEHGNYKVEITTKNGNKTGTSKTTFSKDDADLLFIATLGESGFNYLIPATAVDGQNSVTLGGKYDEYRL